MLGELWLVDLFSLYLVCLTLPAYAVKILKPIKGYPI
jgi:hypothetical protein